MDPEFLHDLRQPLTAIQNFTRACINELHRHPSGGEKVLGWLESVHQQARKATEMLIEAKTQGPSVNCPPVPTDIRRCIENALQGLRDESGISVGVLNAGNDAEPCVVLGDPSLLEPVFRDLLVGAVGSRPREEVSARTLAIDIGREKSDLVLQIEADAPNSGTIRDFQDTGAEGIEYSALVAGLSTCGAIIENHGGSLALWRRRDGTVRVQVRLPAYQQEGGIV